MSTVFAPFISHAQFQRPAMRSHCWRDAVQFQRARNKRGALLTVSRQFILFHNFLKAVKLADMIQQGINNPSDKDVSRRLSFTGFSCMNICLRISTSQIHKKIKLDKKMKINMQLYFGSLVQCILTHILMITRTEKDFIVLK